jgi:pimeloyl-ACP methyl ester carboxylesterase
MRPVLLSAAETWGRHALTKSGARSAWFPSRRGHIHYYDIAGGGALHTVALLHGLGTSATAFAPLLKRLNPHFGRLLAPDHLGHGFSSGQQRSLTPDDVLEATIEVLSRTLHEPALLVGNSMGGAIALKFALRYPEKVSGLLLVSPAGAPFSESEWQELVSAFDITSRGQAMQLFHRIYQRPPWGLQLLAHEMPAHFQRPATRALLESAATSADVTPGDLQQLETPLLLLWGRSDRLLPRSQLAYFRTHLSPRALVEEPAEFGHSPHLDATRLLADYIVRFAQSVSKA